MQYTTFYESPIGRMLLAADDAGLTGLWFEGQKYFARCLDRETEEKELPVFAEAKRWLDIYFSGKEPDFTPPLHFIGTSACEKARAFPHVRPSGRRRSRP